MEIKWQTKALKQLRKLKDKIVIKQIGDAVKSLEEFPKTNNVKQLSGHQYDYRLRIGNYRVMFNVNKDIEIVFIEEVKKRDERTY